MRDDTARPRSVLSEEDGLALLITLIALSLFSLMGFYMSLNATTEVRISDNFESAIQARFAAQAGVNHAREVLRGLSYDDLLMGPDGTYDGSPSYTTQARTIGFRSPVSWATARSLDIFDPSTDVSGLPDDGLLNTGSGTVLIPMTGVVQTAPNPYGAGTVTLSRYFVKVTDNNGEAAELAKDINDDPFHDGDGMIVIRSMGVAQTIRETAGAAVRRNSVAVFEARFRISSTFDFDSPLTIAANDVNASFDGNAFDIIGNASYPGIAVIDFNTGDGIDPGSTIAAATGGQGTITGGGLPEPSIADITASVAADPETAMLMDPAFLYDFVYNKVPKFADYVYQGDQGWSGGSAPYIGYYNPSLPKADPSQDPKVTVVNGDLSLSGNMTGGGLLVVTGDFIASGTLTFNGLVLVIGSGNVVLSGLNQGIHGGLFVANLTLQGGIPTFGTPTFSVSGNSDILIDADALLMGSGLIPASQRGFREVTSSLDP